jgi:hypothetical protein
MHKYICTCIGVRLQTMMSDKKLPKALLDSSTLWRISLTLSKPGCASIDAIARLRFIEDRNFEPPQVDIYVYKYVYTYIQTHLYNHRYK